MRLHFFTLLFICFSFQLFSNSNNSLTEEHGVSVDSITLPGTNFVTDSTFLVLTNEVTDTIVNDFYGYNFIYQVIEINNFVATDSTPNVYAIEQIESTIPDGWYIEFCNSNTFNSYEDCSNTYREVELLENDFLDISYSIQGTSVTEPDEAVFKYKIYNLACPTYSQTLTFTTHILTDDNPTQSTGFMLFPNQPDAFELVEGPYPVNLYNSVDISNPNDGIVEIGWEVFNQSRPSEWDGYFSFSLPNQFFDNQDIPTTGTFTLLPGEYYPIEMFTDIINTNGVSGVRNIEIDFFDINDPVIRESISFNAEVEVADSESGFMIYEPNSIQDLEIIDPWNNIDFWHFFEFQNLNIFEETTIGWEVITKERPAEWEVFSHLFLTGGFDHFDYLYEEFPNTGTFILGAGDFAMLEYIMPEINPNGVNGSDILEIVFYDTQDSANTAIVVRAESNLQVPEAGAGMEIWETYSGSLNYVYDPNEPIFAYLSPLYASNPTDNIVEVGWEKIEFTTPSDWTFNYDFNVKDQYYNTEIPDDGSFFLYPYEEGYFALNFNEIYTNGQAGEAELKILVYDKNDSLNNNHVLTFQVSVCVENSLNELILPPAQTSYCEGDIITLETVPGLQNIQWSTGQNTPGISIPVQEQIYITAEDENGCPQNDEIFFDIEYPYNESVCIVTVDEVSGGNMVVWEKTPDQNTAFFNIYKETNQAEVYELVGSQPYDDESTYIDTKSNPMEASSRYKIAAVNDCGAESDLSSEHKTMHLTINSSTNNDVNLIWDPYEGFDYLTFNILRGNDPNNMSLIAQRPSNTFTFTDINSGSSVYYYQIEIEYPGSCDPNRDDVNSTRSNIVNFNSTSNNTIVNHQIEIFPNPFSSEINLRNIPTDVHSLTIKDVSGRTLLRSAVNDTAMRLDVNNLPSGMYFVEMTGEEVYVSKIVK